MFIFGFILWLFLPSKDKDEVLSKNEMLANSHIQFSTLAIIAKLDEKIINYHQTRVLDLEIVSERANFQAHFAIKTAIEKSENILYNGDIENAALDTFNNIGCNETVGN